MLKIHHCLWWIVSLVSYPHCLKSLISSNNLSVFGSQLWDLVQLLSTGSNTNVSCTRRVFSLKSSKRVGFSSCVPFMGSLWALFLFSQLAWEWELIEVFCSDHPNRKYRHNTPFQRNIHVDASSENVTFVSRAVAQGLCRSADLAWYISQ